MEKVPLSRILFGAVALVGVYFAAQLAIRLSNLWMLMFGSVVVAVILRSIADPLVRRLKFKDGLAVLTAVLVVISVVTVMALLFGREIGQQAASLAEQLPAAWRVAVARLENSPVGDWVVDGLRTLTNQLGRAFIIAQRVATSLLSGLTTLGLVLVAGVYLAMEPGKSREGLLAVLPIKNRTRAREVLNTCGLALKSWLRAQLLSMVVVGTLTWLGLALIGVPSPAALGLLTGLAQFVPIVGPIVSAVPALLVAATSGGQTFLLTLVLFVGVSQLEANVITPLVQRNVASLSIVGSGTLFGPLGVLFATPLALVLYTVVTMLYREDVLHDPEASAPGEVRE